MSEASNSDPQFDAAGIQRAIGVNVARLRTVAGMTQSDLAARMREAGRDHWRQTTVSRVENGQQRLPQADLHALTEVLGDGVTQDVVPVYRGHSAMRENLRRSELALAASLREIRLARLSLDPGGFIEDHPEYADTDVVAVIEAVRNGQH